MVFTLQAKNGVSVISLPERLDGTNANQAECELPAVVDAGLPVIFDASQCLYISSAGLRLLLVTAKRIPLCASPVVITGMSEHLVEVMRITGFDHVFSFADSVDDAVVGIKSRGLHV